MIITYIHLKPLGGPGGRCPTPSPKNCSPQKRLTNTILITVYDMRSGHPLKFALPLSQKTTQISLPQKLVYSYVPVKRHTRIGGRRDCQKI